MQSPKTMSRLAAPLEQALSPRPAEAPAAWVARLDLALAGVEQAARLPSFAKDDGLSEISDVIPSPGLDRHVRRLRGELSVLAGEAGAIREEMRGLGDKLGAERARLGRVCHRAALLLLGLAQYEQQEGRLLLDSVTTELGAGD